MSRVIYGDSFKVLNTIESESVDLLITDIPYNISENKSNFHTMRNNKVGTQFGEWDKGFDTGGWIEFAEPTLKKGAGIVIFCSFLQFGEVISSLKENGLLVKCPIVLEKTNPVPRNRDRRFVAAAEFAIWAVKPGSKWTFNRREGRGFENGFWRAPCQRGKHPTKKPDNIIEDLISILSNEGDLILDPFAGEGTAGVAAKKLGRDYILIEKEQKYFIMCLENLNNE